MLPFSLRPSKVQRRHTLRCERNKALSPEMRGHRILVFGAGVRPGVHPVAQAADVKTLVRQHVFERSEALEDQFLRQRLVRTILAGDMGRRVDTFRPGDQMTRKHTLCNITESVRGVGGRPTNAKTLSGRARSETGPTCLMERDTWGSLEIIALPGNASR